MGDSIDSPIPGRLAETGLPSSSSGGWSAARLGLLFTALACATLVIWLALKSRGGDWYISETRADVLYTGVRSFHEFPYFSFAINGGSYLLQDPEGPLLSPTAVAVLAFGPTLGLRLMTGVWAAVGVLGFKQWLTGRVRIEAALLSGVAATTSLAVLWKVAVGNDMFLWALGLPGLLYAIRCVVERGTILAAVILGLWIGVFLLGPTFLVGTYLFLPVLPLAAVFELVSIRARASRISRTLPLLIFACVLGLAIASPKLAMWLALPMHRPTEDHGVLSLAEGVRGLWDYAITRSSNLSVTSYDGEKIVIGGWDISEGAMALSPIASLLAGVGILGLRKGPKRRLALLAVALVALGITLSCCWPVWHAVRSLTHDSIRVAPRFIAVAIFGAWILVAIGADIVLGHFHQSARWLTIMLAAAMLACAIIWVRLASQNYGLTRNDAVAPDSVDVFHVFHDESGSASNIQSFARLVPMNGTRRDVLAGAAVVDGYRIVGNAAEPFDWWHGHPHSLFTAVHPADAKSTTVTHLSVQSRDLATGARLQLRLALPSYGFRIKTVPPGMSATATRIGNYLVLTNKSQSPLQSLTLKATLPISRLWFVLAGVCLFSSLAFAGACLLRQQRSTAT